MIDWGRLIEEHREWTGVNFPRHEPIDSVIGVIEELGELAHCHLKEKQGIRGSSVEHREESKDAIADMTIYLLGVMEICGSPVTPMRRDFDDIHTPDEIILQLALWVGHLVSNSIDSNYIASNIIHLLRRYCDVHVWDYDHIVNETWEKVKKRNWQEDPITGGQ